MTRPDDIRRPAAGREGCPTLHSLSSVYCCSDTPVGSAAVRTILQATNLSGCRGTDIAMVGKSLILMKLQLAYLANRTTTGRLEWKTWKKLISEARKSSKDFVFFLGKSCRRRKVHLKLVTWFGDVNARSIPPITRLETGLYDSA